MNKRKAQIKHAKRRAIERFGEWLADSDINKIVNDIRANKYKSVEKLSRRTTVFRITLPSGKPARAVYDKDRKTIVTLMEVKDDA
jgi:hypothetical protein